MIEVSIPSMEKEVDESGKPRKLFRVEVLFNGRKHFVLRRGSEFQNLHRKLRKIIQTPDLPSKRNPHLRTKPLQQRIQELEDYVQDIIYQNEDVPQVLLDFLHLKHFHTGNKVSSMESLDDLDSRDFIHYQISKWRDSFGIRTSPTEHRVSQMSSWTASFRVSIPATSESASQRPPPAPPRRPKATDGIECLREEYTMQPNSNARTED
ncbi:sorting nexin-22 isoform 1-T1 [Spinachia spinachia]